MFAVKADKNIDYKSGSIHIEFSEGRNTNDANKGVRCFNNDKGIIGSATRASKTKNVARNAKDIIRLDNTTGPVHSTSLPPKLKPKTSVAMKRV